MSEHTTSSDAVNEAAVGSAALEVIVAVAENDVIGRANQLPWRLSADLRRFKTLTLGKPILMGRKTHQSIGRALPGRTNLVLTRDPGFNALECCIVRSVAEARQAAGSAPVLMVIGGAEVYRQCIPLVHRIHLTRVHTRVSDGDAFFAEWRDASWRETFREFHAADEHNTMPFSFITLERPAPLSAPTRA